MPKKVPTWIIVGAPAVVIAAALASRRPAKNNTEPDKNAGGAPWDGQPKTAQVAVDANVKLGDAAVVLTNVLLTAAGLSAGRITSGTRNAAEQAKAMFDNLEAYGVKAQRALYGANGDKVIDVYVATRPKGVSATLAAMTAKIEAIGPSKVSRHASNTMWVWDVAPSSIADRPAFEKALNDAVKKGWLTKWLGPPSDPAYHLETKRQVA